MIRMAFLFSVISVLFLSVIPTLAQQPGSSNGYFVQHFTDENGLPQNSINDLLFDDDGYLWLGSQAGLICFNGYSFKLFYPNDKPVMQSNILTLGKSPDGLIYFQTDDQNLYCYPGNNSHRLSPVNTAALRGPRLLNGYKQLFDFTRFQTHVPKGEPSEKRKRIFQDLFEHKWDFYAQDSQRVYLVYKDSLYYYDGDSLQQLCGMEGNSWLLSGRRLYMLKRGDISAVYENGRKTADKTFMEGDLKKDLLQHTSHWPPYRLFSTGDIHHLLVGDRLYRLSVDSKGVLSSEFLLDLGFTTNISSIEYNQSLDLLLVATATDGFYYLRKSPFQSGSFPAPLKELLEKHLFGPMALYKGSEILTTRFGFDAAGKYRLMKDSENLWHTCIYITRKEDVWGATHNHPRKMTPDMREVKVFPTLDARIVDYKEDEKGNLYCLTERSLWRLEGDSFRLLISGGQLPLKEVNECLSLVAPHRFWIGNVTGLMEYDADNGELKTFGALADAHIRCITPCRDGSILLGTYGQGYFYYRRQRFMHMPLDRNEFLITAHSFLEDNRENIWIPCNKGLFKVPKTDMDAWFDSTSAHLNYYYYGRQDGLLTDEFNGGYNSSGILTKDGFAALLSMKGMVCFHTDSLTSDFPKGRVNIAGVEIDGKAWVRTDSINLPADYNSLLVTLSCPFLGNRNNLHLEYHVRGLNEPWKEVPDDGVLDLSRLAPGNYTLRVRKLEGFGKDNYSYREWPLTVAPHFYQAIWFWLLVGLALLILVITVVQLSLMLGKKRKEVQTKAEESRQALMHTGNLRQKLISLVIHDLRSPLRFLTMLAGDLHDNHANYSGEEIKDRVYWIKKGAQDVYNFSEDFLLWVTSQRGNFTISRRLIHLKPLLQEIYDFFLDQVQQKGNTLTCEAADDLTTWSDPHILITVIRNLVDNANKYTDGGGIVCRAYEKDAFLIISVSDTGKGMSPKQIQFFLQQVNLENIHSGSQLGHKFVFDLTHRLNGAVSIESKEGLGTTVTLSFRSEGKANGQA